jgi:RNA polymerase sigma-70 factor (ECF subfamily)
MPHLRIASNQFDCTYTSSRDLDMSAEDSFTAIMRRLKRRDQDAESLVYLRFRDRLIALAQSRLDKRIKQREDPEDVVQSAYRSFFRRCATAGYEFTDWDDLWNILTVITVCKSMNRVEYHLAKRRSVAGEVSGESTDDLPGLLVQCADRDPTPLEAAILAETVEGLVRALKPQYRPVLELNLQGYSTEEIAQRTNRAETTIRRQKRWIKERLRQMQAKNSK